MLTLACMSRHDMTLTHVSNFIFFSFLLFYFLSGSSDFFQFLKCGELIPAFEAPLVHCALCLASPSHLLGLICYFFLRGFSRLSNLRLPSDNLSQALPEFKKLCLFHMCLLTITQCSLGTVSVWIPTVPPSMLHRACTGAVLHKHLLNEILFNQNKSYLEGASCLSLCRKRQSLCVIPVAMFAKCFHRNVQ